MYRKIIRFGRIICIMLMMLLLLVACGSEQNNVDIPDSVQEVETVLPEQKTPKSVDENPVESSQIIEKTVVQQTYEDVTINSSEFLSLTNQGYTFKGYRLSNEDVVKIGNQLVVNQGAMYEQIGAGLSIYCQFGVSSILDEMFFQILIGTDSEPDNWAELSQELYEFIFVDVTEKEIISKLEILDTVSGSFDYEARNYSFEISNLEKTADDLHISQEMLGYVLAKLNEYTDDIVFDGNSITCSLEVKTFS